MSEDIAIAEPLLPLQVRDILDDSTPTFSHKIADLMALMMKTKKTRFISECRSYWLVPSFLEDNSKSIFHSALKKRHPEIEKECGCFEKCFLPGTEDIQDFVEEDEVGKTLVQFWKKSTVK